MFCANRISSAFLLLFSRSSLIDSSSEFVESPPIKMFQIGRGLKWQERFEISLKLNKWGDWNKQGWWKIALVTITMDGFASRFNYQQIEKQDSFKDTRSNYRRKYDKGVVWNKDVICGIFQKVHKR